MSNIVQWNIRGLQANREELVIILSHLHPSVVCLQETFLKKNKIVRKILSPVSVFHFWPKLPHPAARSLCDSWASW